jgi:hypothetical protein
VYCILFYKTVSKFGPEAAERYAMPVLGLQCEYNIGNLKFRHEDYFNIVP